MQWSTRQRIIGQAIDLIREFERICRACGQPVPQMPPIPVEAIANLACKLSVKGIKGLSVSEEEIAGFLDPKAGLIAYEEEAVVGRQRFSIAHEIGHYIVHYLPREQAAQSPSLFQSAEVGPQVYFRCTPADMELSWADLQPLRQTKVVLSPDEIRRLKEEERHAEQEVEANTFAAELLMPADLVRQLSREYRGDVDALKQVFNVSRQAMEVRLVSLKLKRDFGANLWCDPQLSLW